MSELTNRIDTIGINERIIYHSGNLPIDRQNYDDVQEVACKAWRLYRDGRVELFQKRNGDIFDYYIVGRATRDNIKA